ncbi:hypothetical protein [Caulobacter sp. DWR1-3-2b1]|uniref:hypothetical protein n=1 Tax=Caulobacter sp. DWR1-3-2b1 TaxID=2804670 RepID=UPI003CEDF580
MTRINSTEGLVALLRQRLLARAKTGGARPSAAAARAEPSLVQALAEIEGLEERPLRRVLIQEVLADHFGRELVNDARFQQVVDRVTAALDEDPETSQVFARVIADLRAGARP